MAKLEQGMLYNYTGNGKGKTTGALGTVLRALGYHWKVAILQFLKDDRVTGEKLFFREYFPEILFEDFGLGFTIKPGDHKGFALAGWKKAAEMLNSFDGDLLVLDEINVALSLNFLAVNEVCKALLNRRKTLNVIVTGRDSPAELLEISDLVSDIQEVKHPYQKGILARKGMEY